MYIFLLFLLVLGTSSCVSQNLPIRTGDLTTCDVDWYDGNCKDYPNPYNFIALKSEPKPDSVMLHKRLKQIFPNSTKVSGKINIRMFTTAKDSAIKAAFIESSELEDLRKPTLEAIKFLKSLPALDYPNTPIDCWSSYPIYFPIK